VILIGAFWSPIFAVIIAVPLFALFLAYVGISRRADQKHIPGPRSGGEPASGEGETGGPVLGERRP
jgi:hypothetical protein